MPFVGAARVVVSNVYTNPAFPDRKVSTGGAMPQGEGWVVTPNGYSIGWDDGTRGICKPPFKTQAEAQAWADEYNAERNARFAAR